MARQTGRHPGQEGDWGVWREILESEQIGGFECPAVCARITDPLRRQPPWLPSRGTLKTKGVEP